MPDDYSANTETTGRVTVGDPVTGEIQRGYDRDWFAVTLVAGKTYWIDLEGSQTGGGTLLGTRICSGGLRRGRRSLIPRYVERQRR